MRHWLNADDAELEAFVRDNAQPKFRAAQIRDWLHGKRVATPDAMTNLPAPLRARLSESGRVRTLSEIDRRDAADGLTSKWLFGPHDAPAPEDLFESVLIVEKRGTRRTVCVSCMIGCPLGCVFCATGKLGFTRNLAPGEIIEQVYRIDEHARLSGAGQGVSHIVFMGMGEPLLNLDAVLRAADVFTDPKGMGLSGRHVTISTAGVVPGILSLADASRNYRLAVSLHAPDQALRERLMPSAKRWPLTELFAALERFSETSSRAVTFEYCLIRGVNDSPAQARDLASLVHSVNGKVNLIPWNGAVGAEFSPSDPSTIRRFQEALESRGVSAPLRAEKGAEIGAACGQLRAERK